MKIPTWQADSVYLEELVPDSTVDWVYGITLFSQGAIELKSRIGSELRGPKKSDPDAYSTETAGKMVVIVEESSEDFVVIILEEDNQRKTRGGR